MIVKFCSQFTVFPFAVIAFFSPIGNNYGKLFDVCFSEWNKEQIKILRNLGHDSCSEMESIDFV